MSEKVKGLKMVTDQESLGIFIDKGKDKEPVHVCYWHKDEWIEDPKYVVPAMLKAIDLFNNNQRELLRLLGIDIEFYEIEFE